LRKFRDHPSSEAGARPAHPPLPPAQAESPANLPVSILPNLVDLDSGARAAFVSNASRLIVFDRPAAYVWDVGTKRLVRRIAYEIYANAAVLTPDEETLVSGHMDGKIRLRSIATGALAGSMQETPVGDEVDEITALSVSADGALLVSGSIHGAISVWDLKTRQKSRSFKFSPDPARNARFIALRQPGDLGLAAM
jgi:WD40 repeat protein